MGEAGGGAGAGGGGGGRFVADQALTLYTKHRMSDAIQTCFHMFSQQLVITRLETFSVIWQVPKRHQHNKPQTIKSAAV